jgi:hypothetical protein
MKYFPKSKLGLAVAVVYLLPVFFLLYVSIFGGGGLHGSGAMASLFLMILASPLSWIVVWIVDVLPLAKQLNGFIALGGVLLCAFINATVIYFVVGWVSRKIAEYFSRLSRLRNNIRGEN